MTAAAVSPAPPAPVLLLDLSSLFWPAWHSSASSRDLRRPPSTRTMEAIKRCMTEVEGALVAVCCDSGRNWRREREPTYKANRPEKDPRALDELRAVQELLVSAGLPVWSAAGFEADDLIATATRIARAAGHEVTIASADKDLLQLVDDDAPNAPAVRCLRTHTWTLVGSEGVREKFGVMPARLGDWLALVGDTSDNIKGARGIGEKKATALLVEFGSLAAVFEAAQYALARVSNVVGPSAAVKLADDAAQVQLARELVGLRTDAPIHFAAIYDDHPSPKEEDTMPAPAAPAPAPPAPPTKPATPPPAPPPAPTARPAPAPVPAPRPAPAPAAPPPRPAAARTTPAPRAPAALPTPPPSRLGKVQRGRIRAPRRIVVYGPEGVGKSTLALGAPDPIFLDLDDGTCDLDAHRYPFVLAPDGTVASGGHVPRGYADVLAAIDDLTTSPHAFQTLVIDTADKLESLMWRWMLERDSAPGPLNKNGRKLKSVEEYGYGKGYNLAVDEWRAFCTRLDRLRVTRGMTIVILAHAKIFTFKNPEGDDFDRFSLRINPQAGGYLREWADATLFACWEEVTKKGEEERRAKGFSTGVRILRTQRTAAYDAKTRLALPDEITLDAIAPWAPLAAAIAISDAIDPAELQRQIAAELERIGDVDVATRVNAAVATAIEQEDVAALGRYLMDLRAREGASTPKEKGTEP